MGNSNSTPGSNASGFFNENQNRPPIRPCNNADFGIAIGGGAALGATAGGAFGGFPGAVGGAVAGAGVGTVLYVGGCDPSPNPKP